MDLLAPQATFSHPLYVPVEKGNGEGVDSSVRKCALGREADKRLR